MVNLLRDKRLWLGGLAAVLVGGLVVFGLRGREKSVAALAAELRKVGAGVDEFPDGLRITPRPLHGAEIETYNDHRMAMSLALVGLKVPGVVIRNPGCVAKTYPGFWQDLEKVVRVSG